MHISLYASVLSTCDLHLLSPEEDSTSAFILLCFLFWLLKLHILQFTDSCFSSGRICIVGSPFNTLGTTFLRPFIRPTGAIPALLRHHSCSKLTGNFSTTVLLSLSKLTKCLITLFCCSLALFLFLHQPLSIQKPHILTPFSFCLTECQHSR